MAAPGRLRFKKVSRETTTTPAQPAENKPSQNRIRTKGKAPRHPTSQNKTDIRHNPIRRNPPRKSRPKRRGEDDISQNDPADPRDGIAVAEPSNKHEQVWHWLEESTLTHDDMASGNNPQGPNVAPSVPASQYSGEDLTRISSTTATRGPATSSGKSLTGIPTYYLLNLAPNGVFLDEVADEDIQIPFPESIATLIEKVVKRKRGSFSISEETIREELEWRTLRGRANEPELSTFLTNNLPLPNTRLKVLQRQDMQLMTQEHTPHYPQAKASISTPKPDILYGYSPTSAFSRKQQDSLIHLDSKMLAANTSSLLFPFLVVELKCDEPLWGARNQCLGSASTCVRIMEKLKAKLRMPSTVDAASSPKGKVGPSQVEAQAIESVTFSLAANGLVAMLYVTWYAEERKGYLTRLLRGFYLHDPDQFITLHDHVHNILDWASGPRLEAIRKAIAGKQPQYH